MAGGAPARLLDMYRPPGGDFPAELAVTIHAGTAFVIASQDPTRTPAAESADRAAVHTFLAGIRIQRWELGWSLPNTPGWASPARAGSQPRLNLPVPLTARSPP